MEYVVYDAHLFVHEIAYVRNCYFKKKKASKNIHKALFREILHSEIEINAVAVRRINKLTSLAAFISILSFENLLDISCQKNFYVPRKTFDLLMQNRVSICCSIMHICYSSVWWFNAEKAPFEARNLVDTTRTIGLLLQFGEEKVLFFWTTHYLM